LSGYREPVQCLDPLIVLAIFHDLMAVLTEQRRFFHEDRVLATRLLIGVMNSENAHTISALLA
jgi:hypothetical protein